VVVVVQNQNLGYLPAIGVLSAEELEGVLPLLPLVTGVEVFLGVEEPKPTGVCL